MITPSGFKIAVGRRHRQCRPRNATHLGRARLSRDEVVALASRRSQGTDVSFGDRTLKVHALENYDFSDGRHRPDVRRRFGIQGMVAENRRPGLRGDR
jgi:hypothetical protein